MSDKYWLRTIIAVSISLALLFVLFVLTDSTADLGRDDDSAVERDLFQGLEAEDVTRIDVIGYHGAFTIFLADVQPDTAANQTPRVGRDGTPGAPARTDRVLGFTESFLSTYDARTVTLNEGRHEELGVGHVDVTDSLNQGEYIIRLWSGDESHRVYVGVSAAMDVLYLRGEGSTTVYATADSLSRILSQGMDWFVDYRLFRGAVSRSEIRSVRFTGLIEAEIERLERGFTTTETERGGAAEAAAATAVSRLLSLEGGSFLLEPVREEDAIMRIDIYLETSGRPLSVHVGPERERGYPASLMWPASVPGEFHEMSEGVLVFDHLVDELLLALSSL